MTRRVLHGLDGNEQAGDALGWLAVIPIIVICLVLAYAAITGQPIVPPPN